MGHLSLVDIPSTGSTTKHKSPSTIRQDKARAKITPAKPAPPAGNPSDHSDNTGLQTITMTDCSNKPANNITADLTEQPVKEKRRTDTESIMDIPFNDNDIKIHQNSAHNIQL